MMRQKNIRTIAQVSTIHTAIEGISVPALRDTIAGIQNIIPLDAVIIGGQEHPEVFQEVTNNAEGIYPESYLWYNFLSDYPGQTADESIIDFRGNSSGKWFGWGDEAQSDVSETFLFSCPNNPLTRQKTLDGLKNILEKYPFKGVFLDKIRFPSPASGLEMMMSCFCPHCQAKAKEKGLDLALVREKIADTSQLIAAPHNFSDGCAGLLIKNDPVLKSFFEFRQDSITEIVTDACSLTQRMNRKIGLDLFSPMLAGLVGQDYPSLVKTADWVKPMTYRYAMGPAGLRLELQSFFNDLMRFGMSDADFFSWAESAFPWFSKEAYAEIIEREIPFAGIQAEIQSAVRQARALPVYMGLETVSFPGVIDMTPEKVTALVNAGMDAGVNGFVFSWDLLHTPTQNVEAVKAVYERRNQ